MSKKQIKKRIAEVLRSELEEPERWHYISFADKVFMGAVIIKGHGITDCLRLTYALNINPGGQALCLPMSDELIVQVPEADRTRLLTMVDVQRIWPDAKTLREHKRTMNTQQKERLAK